MPRKSGGKGGRRGKEIPRQDNESLVEGAMRAHKAHAQHENSRVRKGQVPLGSTKDEKEYNLAQKELEIGMGLHDDTLLDN